ncbi:ATP synthase F0 subunit A [Streptococcus pneumoniae]|nr:ATP synthase F0 subunit A [Streptococcus pneumoniae]
MEESINPIISIGPVIFNLTMLAMTLLIVGSYFCLYLLGKPQYDLETQRKAKCT